MPDATQGATRVALLSFAVAVAVAGAKLAAGILSGSVAVLSDGLHSVLDAGATGLTLFAVQLARKPPDREHPYGHGRAENLVAFAEACLLVVVSGAVGVEAVRRLVAGDSIEAPPAVIAVMAAALVVDVWRSTALARAARRYQSQALAADSLNFRSDVLATIAVLTGLLATRAGFAAADPIAALVVTALVWVLAVRIGAAAVDVLMDRSPEGLDEDYARAASEVSGVEAVTDVRVRRSGPHALAEVQVAVGRTSSVQRSHEIAEAVRTAVEGAAPNTSAVVTVQPTSSGEDIVGQVFAAANRVGFADQVHNVLAVTHPEGTWLMLHAKVPPQTPLEEAHRATDTLEREIRSEVDGLARVEIHVEPRESQWVPGRVVSASHDELARTAVTIAESHAPITGCHEVAVTETSGGLHVVLHCEAPPHAPILDVHEASRKVEDGLHRAFPDIATVTVHFEPAGQP